MYYRVLVQQSNNGPSYAGFHPHRHITGVIAAATSVRNSATLAARNREEHGGVRTTGCHPIL